MLTSCDSYLHFTGIIVDAETGKPIENARIYHVYDSGAELQVDSFGGLSKTKTDSFGRFLILQGWRPFKKVVEEEIPPLGVFVSADNYKDSIMWMPFNKRELFELKQK